MWTKTLNSNFMNRDDLISYDNMEPYMEKQQFPSQNPTIQVPCDIHCGLTAEIEWRIEAFEHTRWENSQHASYSKCGWVNSTEKPTNNG